MIAGLGYVTKTFILPFSAVFFLLALACGRSLKRTFALVLASAAIMAAIAAPLIWAQSTKAGRLSYGEAGNYNYAYFVAGQGHRIHVPRQIHNDPTVLIYDTGTINTYPPGTDPAYWHLGVRPTIDVKAQLSRFLSNVKDMLGGTALPLAAVLLWFCGQLFKAPVSAIRIRPPSLSLILGVISLLGIAMYCLIIMELRYVAPFIFLGFAALVCFIDYSAVVPAGAISFDASVMGPGRVPGRYCSIFMCGSKLQGACFYPSEAISSAVLHGSTSGEGLAHGPRSGQRRGCCGLYPPRDTLRWARPAGVRVVAEVRGTKPFAEESGENRIDTLNDLRREGISAVVTKRPFAEKLGGEGGTRVPGTNDYSVKLLNNFGP